VPNAHLSLQDMPIPFPTQSTCCTVNMELGTTAALPAAAGLTDVDIIMHDVVDCCSAAAGARLREERTRDRAYIHQFS